ncbi:hypothetical protein QM012_005090 [Aureobasidium pullulans]|uniref:Uncharacterized protein n=1 Tax=Aureobasidium pullulans TaxID=5580 RepID=A0ABR0T5Q5_AURPU
MPDEKKSSFDPAECAILHNQILQRATQQSPDTAQSSRDALQAYSDATRARLLPDLQEFLDTLTVRPATSLTPFSLHPDPETFFQYENNSIGGLFFLQHHKLASWIESDLQLPPKSSWLPLATILERWLHMWNTGKITSNLELMPWCEHDLQATLEAWNELVDAIEDRLPTSVPQRTTHEPLIEKGVAERWTEQSFQHAFLTRARRPAFSSVAPGVSVWTDKSFEAAHASEPHDSERKQVIGRKPEDGEDYQSALSRDLAPTLLFPGRAVESAWGDHSRPSLRDYKGRGSALLNRRAGLYLSPDEYWSDAVVFSDGRGRENLFTYRGSCPWKPGRPPTRLRDIFHFWKKLVVEGAWTVKERGVFGNMAYFHCLMGTRKSADIDFCADWNIATSY